MTGNLALVAAGGACGAVLRYLSVVWLARVAPGFPWGTLFVNVAGSAAMGVAAVVLLERIPGGARVAPLAMAGFLGGFTTFSAFSLDTVLLVERGRLLAAVLYVLGSVTLSVLALAAGMAGARAVLETGP